MPKLFLIKETYDLDERWTIEVIERKYIELIKKYMKDTEVYVVGTYDKEFWEEVVLSKPKDMILDPHYEFPVTSVEDLTHFGAITFEAHTNQEFYYGNKDLKLEEFAKVLLSKAIAKYEKIISVS